MKSVRTELAIETLKKLSSGQSCEIVPSDLESLLTHIEELEESNDKIYSAIEDINYKVIDLKNSAKKLRKSVPEFMIGFEIEFESLFNRDIEDIETYEHYVKTDTQYEDLMEGKEKSKELIDGIIEDILEIQNDLENIDN